MAVPFRSDGGGGGKVRKAASRPARRPQPNAPAPRDVRPSAPSPVVSRPTSTGSYKAGRSFGGPATTRMPVPDVPRPSAGGGGPKPPPKNNQPGPIQGGKGGNNKGKGQKGKAANDIRGNRGKTWTNKQGQSAHDIYREGMGIPQQQSQPAQPPGPAIPDIEAYLASDQGFQGGLAELMRALQQFQAQNTSQRGMIESSFQTALDRMASERTNALKSLEADFASRGLLNSGLYGEAIDDYDTEYQARLGDLNTNQQNELNFLTGQFSEYQGNIEAEKARLRQEAIARRAAQFNLF